MLAHASRRVARRARALVAVAAALGACLLAGTGSAAVPPPISITVDETVTVLDSPTSGVVNTTPTVDAGADLAAKEGSAVAATGSFRDPDPQTWTATVDYGDGSPLQPLLLVAKSFSLSHVYEDNGSYVVTIAVTDTAGATGRDTVAVAVANVAPTGQLGNDGPVPEGSSATVTVGGATDASRADERAGLHYAFACDGGSLADAAYATSGAAASTACALPDDGTRTIRARVIDKDGGFSELTTQATATSVAPTATPTADPSVAEGSAASVRLVSPFDPSPVDTAAGFRYAFACDGGSLAAVTYAAASPTPSSACTYDDGPATHTVRARILDEDGAFTEYTALIEVTNVAPSGTLANGGPVAEGAPVEVRYTAVHDPSAADTAAGLRYAFACDGGRLGAVTYATASPEPATQCRFDDGPATHLVRARVIDRDGGYSQSTTEVAVTNEPPTAEREIPADVPEGSAFELGLYRPVDASAADTAAGFEYAFDCGDGAAATFGRTRSHDCATSDDGPRAVQLRIRDKDGGTTAYTGSVAVTNVAPTATFVAPAAVTEGDTYPISLRDVHDPSSADTAAGFRYAFDCGDGWREPSSDSSTVCAAVDDPAATVRARVIDKDGGASEYEAHVAIANAPPTVELTAPAADTFVQVGTNVSLAGTFADRGRADRHSAVWTLDAISVPAAVTETGGAGSAAASFTFTSAGVYAVRLGVSDDDGGTGSAAAVGGREALVAVFDPAAGGVSAKGEVRSPAGSYAPRPGLAATASFEVSARYQHGAVVPRGEAELELDAAQLSFRSTSLRWLVVSGSRAQLSAVGTVGRIGGYRLLATLYERPARVRLELTDPAGAVVYDSVRGASDDLDLADPKPLSKGDVSVGRSS